MAITRAIFRFIWRSKMDRVCRDAMYKPLDKGGKNVPNIALILMATFVCGCIKRCVDPQYANTKCHYVLRFYLSPVLRRMGLATLPRNAPSSWTVPYHLSLVEKFMQKNTFDHGSIGRWSARGVLEALGDGGGVDPVGWFPERTVGVVWRKCLIARTFQQAPRRSLAGGEKGPPRQILPTRQESHPLCTMPSRWLWWGRDRCSPPCGLCLCKESLERDAVVAVEVHPEQFCDTGLCALRAVPRDTHRDKHRLQLEDHQLGERRALVCPKLVGLPAQRVVPDRLLRTGTIQSPGLRAEGRTKAWGSCRKGAMGKGRCLRPFYHSAPRDWELFRAPRAVQIKMKGCK
ncbi:uncharacterized protein LOC144683679 [Cetorhinus maximus]